MTEELRVYAQANRALGALGALLMGDEAHRELITNAIREIDYGLDALLVAAEKPEAPPTEEASEQPRSPWHCIAVESYLEGYEHRPALHGLVLTFSEEINRLQVLRKTDGVIWRDAEDKLFRGKVDYWMPIPPLFDE